MNDSAQIAVVSVPLTEWNQQKEILADIRQQVRELTSREQKELLTPNEVCEYLKISRTTFQRYVDNNVIEVSNISKKKYAKILVRRSHLDELVNEGVL